MANPHIIAAFGEAEKGQFNKPYYCDSLPQLVDFFGNPPKESQGLSFAIQVLMYEWDLIFFRVKEEGFSKKDYLAGFGHLTNRALAPHLDAICLPGVGDPEIIHAADPIHAIHHNLLITTEKDLFDYLASFSTTPEM